MARRLAGGGMLGMGGVGVSCILLVDDEPAILRLLSTLIQDLGIETICTESAESALHLLNTTVPDLIISDVRLPGMSGDELAKRVKSEQRLNPVPVILISAFQEPPNHEANAFIQKPFDLDCLLNTVQRYVAN